MASTVVVQVGQCGNQLGDAILEVLYKGCCTEGAVNDVEKGSAKVAVEKKWKRERFFHQNEDADEMEEMILVEQRRSTGKGAALGREWARKAASQKRKARAVLVDMEPKVIDECLAKKRVWNYDEGKCFRLEGGSGNNWAHGFVQHGPKNESAILELLRREAEATDRLDSFFIIQSVAGGTGSGVGTYLTQAMCDEFPNACRINCLVWPHHSGEVVVQRYNTILSLANLQSTSDCLLCLFNDDARYTCTQMERIERPEMDDLNRVLSRDIASSLLLPSECSSCPDRTLMDGPSTLARHLCDLPSFKCIQSQTVPHLPQESIAFSTHTWQGLMKQISSNPYGRPFGGKGDVWRNPLLLSRVVTVRGRDAKDFVSQGSFHSFLHEFECAKPRIRQAIHTPVVHPRFEDSSQTVIGIDRSISMLSNSQGIVIPLEDTIRKGTEMLQSGAYLHQYERFGLSRDQVVNSFVGVEQIVANYNSLRPGR